MPQLVLPGLGEALKDSNGKVRTAAANALGAMRKVAASAVPQLQKVLKDSQELGRGSLGHLFGADAANPRVAPRLQVSLYEMPMIKEALDDSLANARAAADALGAMGNEAAPAIPELQEALEFDLGADLTLGHFKRQLKRP